MADAAAPPPPSPPANLDARSGGRVLRRAAGHLLSPAALPALLLAALVLLLFRSALLAGTLRLSAAADRDPTLRSLLSRLSSASSPSPPPLPRRRSPFLARTLDPAAASSPDDFLAGTLDPSSSFSPSHRHNASYLLLTSSPPFLSSREPYRLPLPSSPSFPPSTFFFSVHAASAGAGEGDGKPATGHGRAGELRLLDLNRRDAAAIAYLFALLTSAHALAIVGYIAAYSAALGAVFVAVAGRHLRRPADLLGGAVLGARRLTGFAFLRWAARDALVQLLCLWYFADVRDQSQLFKLFVAAKLMPFSLSAATPWPASDAGAELVRFFFAWSLLDAVVSVLFTVVPWVVVMDRDPRRPGRDAVKEGCYLVSLMPADAALIKWWETVVCGSVGRAVMVTLAGRVLGGLLYSLAEVYFMVVWLTFYLAARCKEARCGGRRFGLEDLADSVDGIRR